MNKFQLSLCAVGLVLADSAFAQRDYYSNNGHANTTPAIRHSNPHTKRVIYHSAKAAGYAGVAGAGMYARNPRAGESLYGLHKSTGDAYNANQDRKKYVYPSTPQGFKPKNTTRSRKRSRSR